MKKGLTVILSLIVCLIASLSLGLVGCDCNGGEQPKAYSIVLSATRIKIECFSDYELTATLKFDGETVTGETLTWSCSDTAVATVTQSGVVTGVSEGETTVVCAFGTVSAVCNVIVGGYEIKLEMSETEIEIPFESNFAFDLTVTATKSDEPVETNPVWTSSDTKVATVADGRVTVVGEGECYIRATVTDEHGFYVSARCKLIIGSEKTDEDKHDVTAPDKDWGL